MEGGLTTADGLRIDVAAAPDAEGLARWIVERSRDPGQRCLFAWAGQPVDAVAAELRETLGRSLAYVVARDTVGVCGVMGCGWVPGGGPHGWLRGPLVDARDDRDWSSRAESLARALMGAVPRRSSLSAYPGAANHRLLQFYLRQGLRPGGELSHLFVAETRARRARPVAVVPLERATWASFRELFLQLFPRLSHMVAYLETPLDAPSRVDELVRVVIDGARVEGFVIARERPWQDAELVAVGVRAGARRRGLGRALVESALAWAADRGQPRLALTVVESARPAIALYEALGFARAGSGLDMLVVAE